MKVKALLCVLMLCATIVSAQTGTLKGRVDDKQNNQPLPLSYITIELSDTIIASDTARLNGEYTIRPVPPGRYTIRATYPGYKTVATTDVIIKSDQTTYVDLKLTPNTILPPSKGKKKKSIKLKRVE